MIFVMILNLKKLTNISERPNAAIYAKINANSFFIYKY